MKLKEKFLALGVMLIIKKSYTHKLFMNTKLIPQTKMDVSHDRTILFLYFKVYLNPSEYSFQRYASAKRYIWKYKVSHFSTNKIYWKLQFELEAIFWRGGSHQIWNQHTQKPQTTNSHAFCNHVHQELIINGLFNYSQQVGSDPDQVPSERQVRLDNPHSLYPLLQV